MGPKKRSAVKRVPACRHPSLRAVDYDESYHWVVRCRDCGATRTMTQAQWRRRLLAQERGPQSETGILRSEDTSGRMPPQRER